MSLAIRRHQVRSLKPQPACCYARAVDRTTDSATGAQKTFIWTGAAENIDVSKNGDTLDSASGPWAVFHFVARAHHLTGNNLEWVIENNGQPVKLPNGKIKSYDYQLQVNGSANPFFDMPGLKCVSQVGK